MPGCEDICDDCLYESVIGDTFDAIELALIAALETKHSRKHRDGQTAEAIRHALVHLDELSSLLF